MCILCPSKRDNMYPIRDESPNIWNKQTKPLPSAIEVMAKKSGSSIADSCPLSLTEMTEISLRLGILDLSHTHLKTDELNALIMKNPNLKILDLSGCNNIEDSDIGLLQNLPKLRNLNLSGCEKITNTGLKYINRLPKLETLDLSGCHQITEEEILIAEELPALKHLELDARQQHRASQYTPGKPSHIKKDSDMTPRPWSSLEEPVEEEVQEEALSSSEDEDNVYRPYVKGDSWIGL